MMWRAARWAGTDKRTSSPSVLVTRDKSKPLKFNGGHAAERSSVWALVCVWVLWFQWGLEAAIHRLLNSGA